MCAYGLHRAVQEVNTEFFPVTSQPTWQAQSKQAVPYGGGSSTSFSSFLWIL